MKGGKKEKINRCRRCNQEISDPNAVFGWRCAEILGVSETLSGMGKETFDKFLDGVTKARKFLGNESLTDEQYKRIYSAFAKEAIWKDTDEKKAKEARKEKYPLTSKPKSKISSLDDDLKEYQKRSKLDTVSDVLTAASLIPGLDTVTDLVSIPVALARGDYVGAGLSALGMLPLVGEVADTAKIVRTADKISDTAKLAKTADKAVDAAKAVDKAEYFSTKVIHSGRQGKHIIGHNNYIEGKSLFSGTMDDAQKLIEKYSGTGQKINSSSERVDFKKVIGKYVDKETGKMYETTIGTIRYSKDGAHIVPARPKNWRE